MQKRSENTQTLVYLSMMAVEQAGAEWDREQLNSGRCLPEKPCCAECSLMYRIDVHKMMKKLMRYAINKTNSRVIDIA